MKSIDRSRIYQTWYDMHRRCYDTKCPNYKNWGARGISVCERWNNETDGFKNFFEDMQETWFPGATIDRIDNDGDYTPENCQWLTRSENIRKSHKGKVTSEDAKQKMRESRKGKIPWNKGLKLGSPSKETIEKRSIKLRGLKKSEDTKQKMRKPKSVSHKSNMAKASQERPNCSCIFCKKELKAFLLNIHTKSKH